MKWLNKLSLRNRMTIMFAIPLIALELLVNIGVGTASLLHYEKRLDYSLEQSRNQATAYLTNTIQNMKYLCNQIEDNSLIQETLTLEGYGTARTFTEEYTEFYRLNLAFDKMELDNPTERMILYVPERVFYKENEYYFYSLNRLTNRSDYVELLAGLEKYGNYFSVSFEKTDKTAIKLNYKQMDMLTVYHSIRDNVGAYGGRQIGICSVSISLDSIRQILTDANITKSGSVFLVNANDEIVVSSNTDVSDDLRSSGVLKKNEFRNSEEMIRVKDEGYYISAADIGIDGWKLVSAVPRSEYIGGLYPMIYFFVFGMILMLLVIYAVSRLLANYYTGRLATLSSNMKELQSGDLSVQLPSTEVEDEMEEVYSNFNFMVEEVRKMLQEHYRLGKDVKNAELKALQAQINPHFLYNTLDLINWMALDYDAVDIENITRNLARFYRLSLNHGKSLISIREEIEHVHVYAAIENFHYEGAIHLTCDIPKELEELACLNIIMQPFVENSIVHGIAEHPEITDTQIWIQARQEGEILEFRIEDDGPGMSEEAMQTIVSLEDNAEIRKKGYGIRNINFRIKLCFGEQYGVSYERPEHGGVRAIVRIPALSMEEAEKLVN